MNDRYKYRVWDKENKCMHYPIRYSNFAIVNGTVVKIESYPTANSAYLGKRIAWEFNDAVIMQCTGLKDKNGKLIYEGDIVRFAQYEIEDIEPDWEYTEVIWGGEDKYPAFDLKYQCFDSNGLSWIFNENYIIEVIGNIYENKDLLNEK